MDKYLRLSWKELETRADNLVEKIPKNNLDNLICIGSGGLVLGKLMSDRMDLPLGVMTAKAYQKSSIHKEKEVRLGEVSIAGNLYGRILLIDDLVDSGKTMEIISNKFNNMLETLSVKTATIYIKPNSTFIPDYYMESTDKWVIFPYEKNEFENLK